MQFKNFLASVIKSLIILVLATLIFSSATFEFPELVKGMLGDIFKYANPQVQKNVVDELSGACSGFSGGNAVTISQICANKTLLDSMKEDCENYRELKRKGIRIENEQQVRETCQQVESGELEQQCSKMRQSSMQPDFGRMEALCKGHNDGKIDDNEFFVGFAGSALPSQMPSFGFLEGYNKAVSYLDKNKILYFAMLAALLAGLYFLVMDTSLFIMTLAQISFSLGTLIMLPYLAIIAYEKFIGFDTSSMLEGMFGNGNTLELKSAFSLILLVFLRAYSSFIVTLGIILLAIGTAGKIYFFMHKGKIKTETKIKDKKKGK